MEKYSFEIEPKLRQSLLASDNPVLNRLGSRKRFSNTMKDKISYLGFSKRNETNISYTNESRFRKSEGNPYEPNFRYSSRIGRVLKKVYPNLSDIELQKATKAWHEVFKSRFTFKVVEGEGIREAYDRSNHSRKSYTASCMTSNSALDYLDMYTENPEVCKLGVMFDEDNKVLARTLLWRDNLGKLYRDTTYGDYCYARDLISFVEDLGYVQQDGTERVVIELDTEFDYYPYLDTFRYTNLDGSISNTRSGMSYELSSEHGSYY